MDDVRFNDDGKIFFTIGEVANFTGLKSHILRYWESEFPSLKPQKGANGRRIYRRGDIDTILVIKRLLYDEGYTIAGARRRLGGAKRRLAAARRQEVVTLMRDELNDLLRVLRGKGGF